MNDKLYGQPAFSPNTIEVHMSLVTGLARDETFVQPQLGCIDIEKPACDVLAGAYTAESKGTCHAGIRFNTSATNKPQVLVAASDSEASFGEKGEADLV